MMYYIKAACRSDTITFPFMGDNSITKNVVSLVVIACDLGIAFAIFFALIFLKMFHFRTSHELNEDFVNPSEFTVQIVNILPQPKDKKALKS